MNVAVDTPQAQPRPARRIGLGTLREYGIVISFVALFLTLSLASENFLTVTNLENIVSQQSPTLIVAAAGTLVIVAGGFDLSVGAIVALAGVVAAKAVGAFDPWLGLAAGLATGAAIGLGNGVVTTAGRVSPLIGTLATSFLVRGLAVLITGGLLVTITDPSFSTLGQGDFVGVPVAILVMVASVSALGFLLAATTYGRRLYAIGGNAEAARLAGIRIGLIRGSTFVLSGLAAGLAGAILASRVATAQAETAVGLEFTVLAGIVVGGTSIQGGSGAVWRTVLGVLFIAMINNGFTLLGLDPIYQQIVQGAIILAAVAFDAWSRPALS